MKVLITGGAGFIGSHLAKKLLERGEQVVIIDNLCDYYSPKYKTARLEIFLRGLPFSFVKADISDFASLEKIFAENKFNKVYHLAAQAGVRYSLENPGVYGTTNIIGTLNLLRLAAAHKVEYFIFASSSSVYGAAKKFPLSETDPTDRPLSLYAATKVAGEAMLSAFSHTHGLKASAFRFFNAYGPWARPDSALFIFTKAIMSGRPIDVFDHGNAYRDFTFVGDIVEGIASADRQTGGFQIFNLGNSHPVRLRDFINALEEALGKETERHYLPARPEDIPRSHADIGKAKNLLGFRPAVDFKKGIAEFILWYRQYEDKLDLRNL